MGKVKGCLLPVVIAVIVNLFMILPGKAAFEQSAPSPRFTGLGGAGVGLADEGSGSALNPASIAFHQQWASGVWSQQYGLPEFNHQVITASLSAWRQRFSLTAGSMGSDLYRETVASVGLAREFGPQVSFGVRIDAADLRIAEYPASYAVGLTAGALFIPQSGISVGGVWRNLNEPRLAVYADRLPETLSMGVAIDLTNEGRVVIDLVQEKFHKAELRLGAEARVLPVLTLRLGASAEPVRPSAGIQIDVACWRFLYAGNVHPDLGWSHETGLAVRLGK